MLVLLAGCLLAGCSLDKWAPVESGVYVPLRGIGAAGQIAAREIQRIEIDRSVGSVTFTMVDGSQIELPVVARENVNWPSGCPNNIYSTRMEVLDIQRDTLVIGSATFSDPVLVRDCPQDPVRLVLRPDGRIGAAGVACTGASECVLFR